MTNVFFQSIIPPVWLWAFFQWAIEWLQPSMDNTVFAKWFASEKRSVAFITLQKIGKNVNYTISITSLLLAYFVWFLFFVDIPHVFDHIACGSEFHRAKLTRVRLNTAMGSLVNPQICFGVCTECTRWTFEILRFGMNHPVIIYSTWRFEWLSTNLQR